MVLKKINKNAFFSIFFLLFSALVHGHYRPGAPRFFREGPHPREHQVYREDAPSKEEASLLFSVIKLPFQIVGKFLKLGNMLLFGIPALLLNILVLVSLLAFGRMGYLKYGEAQQKLGEDSHSFVKTMQYTLSGMYDQTRGVASALYNEMKGEKEKNEKILSLLKFFTIDPLSYLFKGTSAK